MHARRGLRERRDSLNESLKELKRTEEKRISREV